MIKQGLNKDTKDIYEPVIGDKWKDLVREDYSNYNMFVTEGLDIDVTWKKHGDKISQRLFDHDIFDDHKEYFHQQLAQADPTEHKEYAPWIASKYASGGEVRDKETNELTGFKGINHIEDFARVHQALTEFHDAKVKKKLTKNGLSADINSYKSLPDLETAVDKLPKDASKKEELKTVKEGEATKYDSEHWTTIVPQTHAASCAYGAGTKWCTTMKTPQYFNQYNNQGPMHIMIPKQPKYSGEKYQFHLHSDQFMNELDRPADALDVLHNRPNPVIMDHIEKHPDDVARSGKAQLIQIAHDPKEYLNKYIGTGGADVQAAVARLGTPEQKEALVNNPNITSHMKIAFIKGGNINHINKFVNDTNTDVQAAVAQHGTDEHRRALTANKQLDKKVKIGLISSGKNEFITPFLNDKDHDIHRAIMQHGSDEHKEHILYDNPHTNLTIRQQAIETKEPKHLDRFIKSPDFLIRALVAYHGTDKHREMLKDDPSAIVRKTAAGESTLNKV